MKLAPEQPHLNAENRASPEAVRAFVGALNGEPVLEPQPEPSPEAQSSDKLCVGYGTTLSWQDAQKSMSALIAHGRTPAQARKHSPRCERCIKALIGGHDGEAALAATMRGVRGPDAVKRKPRQPRAKVSKVTRGSVPVTLGGRMPPVSVLSRREWGLRALRK